MVHFEGRSYAVPFLCTGREVEVRGCSGRCRSSTPRPPRSWSRTRGTRRSGLLIDPTCYEGPGTAQVLPPKPLGRMARKLQEIALLPVEQRPDGPVRRAGGGGPMSAKGPSPEPEKSSALPARPAPADLGVLVDQLVKLGLDFAAEGAAGDPHPRGQGGPGHARPAGAAPPRRAGTPRGAADPHVAAALGPAHRPDARRTSTSRSSPRCSGRSSRPWPPAAWLREKQGLLILGPPGVGKTHLAVSLGVKAVECGFSVAFFRLEELLHAMRKDAEVPPTRLKGKKYMKARPGDHRRGGASRPFTREDANLFFRLVSYRYRRGRCAITTNKAVKDWPEILAGDEVLTTAILDRLLHSCHVLNIRGRSYRLRDLEDDLNGR